MKTRCDEYIKLISTKLKNFQHTSRAIKEIKRCLSHKSRRHYTRNKMAKKPQVMGFRLFKCKLNAANKNL